jgi:hypothetical protein
MNVPEAKRCLAAALTVLTKANQIEWEDVQGGDKKLVLTLMVQKTGSRQRYVLKGWRLINKNVAHFVIETDGQEVQDLANAIENIKAIETDLLRT